MKFNRAKACNTVVLPTHVILTRSKTQYLTKFSIRATSIEMVVNIGARGTCFPPPTIMIMIIIIIKIIIIITIIIVIIIITIIIAIINEFFREKSIVAIRAKISLEFYLCITHSSVIILTNPEMNMK